MEAQKRTILEEYPNYIEPVLVRLDKRNPLVRDVRISKDGFKIGRAKDNDEIILDLSISRKHCILNCNPKDEWSIQNLSSSSTYVNNIPIRQGVDHKLSAGDVIQLSDNTDYTYVFTFFVNPEHQLKRPRMDESIIDSVLTEQKTFSENQDCQRKELKNRLESKQKEHNELKVKLEELLDKHKHTEKDNEELQQQIITLKNDIESVHSQEQQLKTSYSELLEKLENERAEFEMKLNEERQKLEAALDLSKQEKESLEIKMKEQMEKWRAEQQAEWKKMMEERVLEEKNVQAQLIIEKSALEERLKETERALKEQEAKAEILQTAQVQNNDICIFLEPMDVCNLGAQGIEILDTIDLTGNSQPVDPTNQILHKVGDIMDEQLTCSICSELFIKATTLNCSHTFCQQCIRKWFLRRKECPVCRKPTVSMNRALVLDNFIESMMDNLPPEFKEKRQIIIQEREKIVSAPKPVKVKHRF